MFSRMPKPAARTLPRHRTFPTATRRSLMDRLPVYFETREVGWITAADEASAFTYAESWRGLTGAFPVSLTMPLSRASHDASAILPWAANLLPENATLGTVGHMLGKSPGRYHRSSCRDGPRHRRRALRRTTRHRADRRQRARDPRQGLARAHPQ
ncbi:HipA N-terminal domain-containing protein [Bradyrhizobium sp. ISRA442]|uniref:HipA N-terminal domain-containing protein n=1 Tax=Bradyrhizobium sp. ISRA442 TaxID=2866197 RepID=UPI004048EB03